MKLHILLQVKTHPIAVSIFVMYGIVWAWIGLYIPYHEYTNYGDGEATGLSFFGGLMVLLLPYLLVLSLLTTFSKQSATFYKRLCWLSLGPVAVALICIILITEHYRK